MVIQRSFYYMKVLVVSAQLSGVLTLKRQIYCFWGSLGIPFLGRSEDFGFENFEFTRDQGVRVEWHLLKS